MNPEQRNDFLTLLGMGPRECSDCGGAFTPPPYLDFKEVKICPACGYKRFEAFCETEEGQRQLKEAFERIQSNNETDSEDGPSDEQMERMMDFKAAEIGRYRQQMQDAGRGHLLR